MCRDHRGATHRHYRVADDRAAGYHGDPSISVVRGAHVPGVDVLVDDVPRLQHVPDSDVHPVRVQDPQDPGGLQRGQIYRLHHVLHVYRLASLCAHLLWYQQRLQGLCHLPFASSRVHIHIRIYRRASRRVFLC